MHKAVESFQQGISFYILFMSLDCASYFHFYGEFLLQN